MDGLALGVAGSLALRGMIDHPPCSILNLQHLAMASCRPGRAYDAPPQAAARRLALLVCSLLVATGRRE